MTRLVLAISILALSACTLVYGGVEKVGGEMCACTSPPVNVCTDADTLRVYLAAGTCTGSTCSYEYSQVACQLGCVNGACVGSDPCDGITCDDAPAASCVDGTTLRTFSSSGTCSNGACEYAASDTTCTAPVNGSATCANATCSIACDAGYVLAGNGCVSGQVPGGLAWSPETSGTTNDLYVVWGASATNLWVGGANGVLLHSTDGTDWSATTSPTIGNIDGIWGSSASDFYVAGDPGDTYHTTDGGSTYTMVATNSLIRIWGSSASDVWGISETNTNGDVVHTTDGASWLTTDGNVSSGTYFLRSVWGTSSSDVYVTGMQNNVGVVMHTIDSGTTWTVTSVSTDAFAVWGPAPGSVYALGNATINFSSDSGATWTPQSASASSYLVSMAGSSASDMYIAGYGATLLYGDGETWSPIPLDVTSDFHRIIYVGGSYYVVGSAGTIVRGSN